MRDPREDLVAEVDAAEPDARQRYTVPTPPPPELGFDLAKWNRMSRPERRAVLRYARKQAGK
jgi:hypothetical protein